jgi:hypothetical protein
VDATQDRGSRGGFDSQSGGFWDPSFLKSLPSTAGTFVIAAAATTAEKAQRLRRYRRAAPGKSS